MVKPLERCYLSHTHGSLIIIIIIIIIILLQLLVYADDITILGGSVHTIKENAKLW